MKNKKIIVVIAAISILFISVGYALFSSNLNVSGTASASGEFEFSMTCTPGYSSEVPVAFENTGLDKEGGYSNDSCSVNGNNVSLETDLNYPGAERFYTVKITNTGTISMKLDTDILITGGQVGEYSVDADLYRVYKKDSNDNLNESKVKLEPKEVTYFVVGIIWNSRDSEVSTQFPKTTYNFDFDVSIEQDNS
mgnify:CR=1 FL=1